MHWIILLSWILTYYNEDIWYYAGKRFFYFEYFPEKMSWLKLSMPIKKIRDTNVSKYYFIRYVKLINFINLAIMISIYFIFII